MSPKLEQDQEQLRSLAALFERLLLARFGGAAERPVGAVLLTLQPSGATARVELSPHGIRLAEVPNPSVPSLLSLSGTVEGLRSFFDGTFREHLGSGQVTFEANPQFLAALEAHP